jgi:CheY-like chemotaxis protein
MSHPIRPLPFRPLVLLVEDNPLSRRVAERMLQLEGCDVDVAANGLEAIQRALIRDYDLVLIACHMPLMDGFEATFHLRTIPGPRERVPIIALTEDGPEDVRCREAGMDAALPIPLRRKRLQQTLAKWARPA